MTYDVLSGTLSNQPTLLCMISLYCFTFCCFYVGIRDFSVRVSFTLASITTNSMVL